MKFIGLCGKPMAGKSEVRKILTRQYDFGVINTKSLLVNLAADLTGLTKTNFTDTDLKNNTYRGYKHRQIMGKVGDSIEEMFGEFFLVERAMEPYKNVRGNFVVDSLRKSQPRSFEGWVVEVVSDRGLDTGNVFDEYDRSRINYTITNNGSIEELEKSIADMITVLGIIL